MKLRILVCMIFLSILFSNLLFANIEVTGLLPVTGADFLRIDLEILSDNNEKSIDIAAEIRSVTDNFKIYQGDLGRAKLQKGKNTLQFVIDKLQPRLWSPASPELYILTLTCRQGNSEVASRSVRFGFRTFSTRGGQIYLNDKSIFLRGIAILHS